MTLWNYEIMNDKNNFIPSDGSPLFYPQDLSEGFQGGPGGSSRRKFLKRTGGATAVAFFGWQTSTMKLKAVEDSDDESEHWDVEWDSSDPETGDATNTTFFEFEYQELVDNVLVDKSEDYKMVLQMQSDGGTSGFGLSECQQSLSYSVLVEASVSDSEDNLLGVWSSAIGVIVSCDEKGGLSVSCETEGEGNYDGVTEVLPPLPPQSSSGDNVVRYSLSREVPINDGLPATELDGLGGAYLWGSVSIDIIGSGTHGISVNVSAFAEITKLVSGSSGAVSQVVTRIPEDDPSTPDENLLALEDSFQAVKHN